MAATLTPPGVTNAAGTLIFQSTRNAVLDPAGVTADEGQLHLRTLRTAAYFWSTTVSTWKLAERTFNYIDIGTLAFGLMLPARTYAPAWAGTPVVRTSGQIWPV